jgi:hypothetical protein
MANKEFYPINNTIMEQKSLIITPKTKVLQLIETYPILEDMLISYVPSFSKLHNPLLRKTVARIATLQQAASIGNVDVSNLINALRKKIGQDLYQETPEHMYHTKMPAWFNKDLIFGELDVRDMLEAGEHPVSQVMADLNVFPARKIYKLTAPFLPAPLIDKASSLQYDHWIDKQNDNLFLIYFYKN